MATLNAKKRSEQEIGKSGSKMIRNAGHAPAIIYGGDTDPVSIIIDPVEYEKLLRNSDYKKNLVLEIQIDGGQTERVITKQMEVNSMNNQFIHVDFLRVYKGVPVQVNIPIKVVGISAGQRLGGVMVTPKKTVRVFCNPINIPTHFEIDITKLGVGDNIRAEDIPLGEEVKLVSNPRDIVVKVEATKMSKVGDDSLEDEEGEEGAEGEAETEGADSGDDKKEESTD